MWLQVIGWAGSVLLVYSVLQVRVMRFRVANLASCVVLAFFNAFIQAWPMVGMNVALTVINAYFIVKLLRGKKAGLAFTFSLVEAQDPMVGWFMDRHGRDVAAFHPDLAGQLRLSGGAVADAGGPVGPGGLAGPAGLVRVGLICHDDAVIGLVAFRVDPTDPGFGELLADYVIPAYRDFAPGGFVFSAQGPLAAAGIGHICSNSAVPAVTKYLRTMGFADSGDHRLSKTIPTGPA
jgi:hypothetical protein